MSMVFSRSENTASFWASMPAGLAADLRRLAVKTRFEKGQYVFREHDAYCGIFLVDSGYFKWYKVDDEGNEAVIKIFEPGEIAGLPPLFDKSPHPRYIANLVSLGQGKLIFWPAKPFKQQLRKYSEWMFTFNGYLTGTLKQLALAKASVSLKPVCSRLEDYLLALGAEQNWVNLPMPKYQIASALNTSAESFSRALASLQKNGRLKSAQGLYRLT